MPARVSHATARVVVVRGFITPEGNYRCVSTCNHNSARTHNGARAPRYAAESKTKDQPVKVIKRATRIRPSCPHPSAH